MESKIKEIFTKNLITVHDRDSILMANAVMENRNIRHLPVVDIEGFLVGILSKSDYLALVHLGIDLQSVKVSELMSSPVKTFSIHASVRSVAQLFVAQKISSGLVMDNNEIAGIVTSEDLLRLLAEKDGLEYEIEKMDLGALASEGWISSTSLR